ncbi:hypothetical protein OGAPHI_000515 [Ogataea philodendri]|uniref:Uncharacterized protein n=1 Tax=Ogataea philodendri TaxID=1378263 RepID=A0A9P8PHC6_9ASCO|nr:uncharacterized protein OGAPHI_000515 [Ogataea philodendri]KAH3671292.1 hypothetical protein OGAPHI_000515 [Ogataea philodendri]
MDLPIKVDRFGILVAWTKFLRVSVRPNLSVRISPRTTGRAEEYSLDNTSEAIWYARPFGTGSIGLNKSTVSSLEASTGLSTRSQGRNK